MVCVRPANAAGLSVFRSTSAPWPVCDNSALQPARSMIVPPVKCAFDGHPPHPNTPSTQHKSTVPAGNARKHVAAAASAPAGSQRAFHGTHSPPSRPAQPPAQARCVYLTVRVLAAAWWYHPPTDDAKPAWLTPPRPLSLQEWLLSARECPLAWLQVSFGQGRWRHEGPDVHMQRV